MTSLVSYRATSNNIPIRNPYARRYTTKPKSYSTETEKNNKENNSNTSHSPRYLFGSKEGTSFATPLDLSCSPSPCKDLSPLPPQEVYYKKKKNHFDDFNNDHDSDDDDDDDINHLFNDSFPPFPENNKTPNAHSSTTLWVENGLCYAESGRFVFLVVPQIEKNVMTNMNCYTILKEYFTCPLNLWTKATT